MQQKIDLGTVQETMLIPLWARAVESGKADPIMTDQTAVDVLKRIDYNFEKFNKAVGSQVGCCMRGLLMDQMITNHLRVKTNTLIVEIGAGLDTRYNRLESLVQHWIDIDLPDAMALRKQFFKETDKRTFIAGSILDDEWIPVVKENAGTLPVVFMAEGVLMYFAETQIRDLLTAIALHFPGAYLIFDSLGAMMVKQQKRHDSLKHTSARFQWGTNNINELETWGIPCRIVESRSFLDISRETFRKAPWKARLMLTLGSLIKYRINQVRLG